MKTEADIISRMPLETLFTEYTFLRDDKLISAIKKRCGKMGAIPVFHYDEKYGAQIFHTLFLGHGRILQKECASFYRNNSEREDSMSESEYEEIISKLLTENGITHNRQVHCNAGIADIVTVKAVLELKMRRGWLKAIGQAVSYRYCLERESAAVVCEGLMPSWAVEVCKSVGIRCFTSKMLTELIDWIKEFE